MSPNTPCGGSGASLGVGCMAAWASMAAPGRPHGSVGPPDALGCDNGPWQGPAPLQRRAGGPVRRQSTSRAVAWHWVRGAGELPAALYNGWAVTTGRYRSRHGAPRRRRHTRHATGRATGAVCRAAVGKVALWVTGGWAHGCGYVIFTRFVRGSSLETRGCGLSGWIPETMKKQHFVVSN